MSDDMTFFYIEREVYRYIFKKQQASAFLIYEAEDVLLESLYILLFGT